MLETMKTGCLIFFGIKANIMTVKKAIMSIGQTKTPGVPALGGF